MAGLVSLRFVAVFVASPIRSVEDKGRPLVAIKDAQRFNSPGLRTCAERVRSLGLVPPHFNNVLAALPVQMVEVTGTPWGRNAFSGPEMGLVWDESRRCNSFLLILMPFLRLQFKWLTA